VVGDVLKTLDPPKSSFLRRTLITVILLKKEDFDDHSALFKRSEGGSTSLRYHTKKFSDIL
jgi:hypothetical protein